MLDWNLIPDSKVIDKMTSACIIAQIDNWKKHSSKNKEKDNGKIRKTLNFSFEVMAGKCTNFDMNRIMRWYRA